jgi:hypothetical protein
MAWCTPTSSTAQHSTAQHDIRYTTTPPKQLDARIPSGVKARPSHGPQPALRCAVSRFATLVAEDGASRAVGRGQRGGCLLWRGRRAASSVVY